jgi:hypothetical protein
MFKQPFGWNSDLIFGISLLAILAREEKREILDGGLPG